MTRFNLRLGNHTLSFRPALALSCVAAMVCAIVMMAAYVAALQHAISRGEALREVQRQGPALRSTAEHRLALSR